MFWKALNLFGAPLSCWSGKGALWQWQIERKSPSISMQYLLLQPPLSKPCRAGCRGGLVLRCYSEGRRHGRQGISGRTPPSSSWVFHMPPKTETTRANFHPDLNHGLFKPCRSSNRCAPSVAPAGTASGCGSTSTTISAQRDSARSPPRWPPPPWDAVIK